MAFLTCENHRHLRWYCKDIALNSEGRYTGARNIFFFGVENPDYGKPEGKYSALRHVTFDGENVYSECDCSPSLLIAIERDQA